MPSSTTEITNTIFVNLGQLIQDSFPLILAFLGLAFGILALSIIYRAGARGALKILKGRI